MKCIGFLLLFLTTILPAQTPIREIPAAYQYIVKIGQPAPDFTMTAIDGKTVQLAALKGKVVMLQFTASWCSVCRKEMPHIEADIWRKYRNNPNFALYGVDLDEPGDIVRKFAKEIPISYPIALDPQGRIFYKFAAQGAGVTRNVIIDKTGRIAFMTRLFKEDEFEEMKRVIASLLK
jgi:peroxiredoxin